MPSWNIHLAIAKKINEKLNVEKNSFYIENLLADVDKDQNISRKITHYDNLICKNCPTEQLPNIEEFLKDYKEKLNNNSLILGYYSHLLADYFYNNYVFTNCWIQNDNNQVIGIKLKNGKIIKTNPNDTTQRKKYKHYDFELYGKYLFNNNYVELPKYNENIEKEIHALKNEFYTKEQIKRRINYLNNDFAKENKYKLSEKLFKQKYKLFTKDELDKIFNDCILFILNNINKQKNETK